MQKTGLQTPSSSNLVLRRSLCRPNSHDTNQVRKFRVRRKLRRSPVEQIHRIDILDGDAVLDISAECIHSGKLD